MQRIISDDYVSKASTKNLESVSRQDGESVASSATSSAASNEVLSEGELLR